MEPNKESKRKKDRTHDDDDEKRKERKSKKARTRSHSPDESHKRDSTRKRRRSRSQTPERSIKQEKPNERAEPPVRKAKETDMLNTRTGGAYIPPARLRMMQAQITDKSSIAYQRLAWEALKKSIHGHINKINVGNIGIIIKELLKENIIRGRGLLCRSVIQAQAASPTFTNVYAALVAAVNSRFPKIGELLLRRLVIQFKRGFKRNDKSICISAASFIAHLVNQRVAHEILALELLTLLVETPSDDSVEVAIAFMKESGQKLTEVSSKGVNAIFEMMRNILHEGQLDRRVQYMIEVMFQIWKDGFKDHPAVLEELDLVPEEEQFTHLLMLDDGTDSEDILNVFKHDEKYEENEQTYKTLSKEILGSDAESEEGTGESGSEELDDEDEEEETEQKEMTIIDNTETNLVALRRTIYLTINSSLDFEECAHKLMKMQLKPGQEVELCHMFLDCCAEQRTYEKFYGLLAQRFCNLNRIYIGPFEEIFKDSYGTAHRLDTNRLRNVSKFFAHLLFTDSISWEVLECVRLNEEDTTSSSRIYIKILFQELAEYMGLKKLNDRLKDPTLQGAFLGVFPRDNPKNTRFSINFFTTIGLGGLTDELREHLKQIPKNVLPPPEINLESGSSSDSSSSSSSSDSDSSSDSNEDSSTAKKKDKKKSKKTSKKNKSPKTPDESEKPKDAERWGHDGFYDNYGTDARRHEQTHERDKDNFVIPQMPKRNDRRHQNEDRRRDEDRPRRDDGSRNKERHREDRDGPEGRRNDKKSERRDRERSSRDERPDRDRNSRDERPDKERNSRDERSDRDRDSRDERSDRDRDSRVERPDKDKKLRDERSGKERNSRDERSDKDRDSRDERSDKERNRDERSVKERDCRDERSDKDRDSRDERSDKDNKSRDERPGRENERKDRDNLKRDRDDRRDKKKRSGRNDERRENEKTNKDERKSKDCSKFKKKSSKRDRSSDRDDERRDRNDREERDTRRGRDERHEIISSGVDKDGILWHFNGEYKTQKKIETTKKEVENEKEGSDSESSDSDTSSSSSSNSSSDGSTSKVDDGWDIRGSSVRREIIGRYWDMPDSERETVERSPLREIRRER